MPLGLKKSIVKRHLRLNGHQLKHVWYWPYKVLTLPQIVLLHELVSTRFTIIDIANMLTQDAYDRGSLLQGDNMKRVVSILMTDEGCTAWDEFMKRKTAVTQRKKRQVSMKVFKRISDDKATDEVINEFVIETERKASEQSIVKPADNLGSGSSHSPEVSI